MSTWKVAKSLDVLLSQINALAPGRSKASDGSIGDSAHASRDSDHNPHYHLGGINWVTARDFTHDPAKFNSYVFADTLRINKDRRIKYVISNRRIFSGLGQAHDAWVWRDYHGSNSHDHHVHVSVLATPGAVLSAGAWAVHRESKPIVVPKKWIAYLKVGSTGSLVQAVQRKLHVKVDGIFGPHTDAAVRQYQKARRLRVDGIVGPLTARSLGF